MSPLNKITNSLKVTNDELPFCNENILKESIIVIITYFYGSLYVVTSVTYEHV